MITKSILVILLIAIAFSAGSIAVGVHKGTETPKPKIAPVIIPTPRPTMQPTESPKVVETDPFIDCESTYPNCKGTAIRVRKSQCSKITCCQVGNTWSIYATQGKCLEAQNNVKTQNTTNLNNAINQINLNNSAALVRDGCVASWKMKYDNCSNTCDAEGKNDNRDCAWGFGGPNAAVENNPTLLDQCYTESRQRHSACLGTCTSQYTKDVKPCYK